MDKPTASIWVETKWTVDDSSRSLEYQGYMEGRRQRHRHNGVRLKDFFLLKGNTTMEPSDGE